MKQSPLQSFKHAFKGFSSLFKERNFRIQACCAALAIVLGIYLEINTTQFALILLTIGLVMVAEGFNTAIEKTMDFIHPDYHNAVKKIKDIAAGVVLFASFIALAVAALIFIPPLIGLLNCTA